MVFVIESLVSWIQVGARVLNPLNFNIHNLFPYFQRTFEENPVNNPVASSSITAAVLNQENAKEKVAALGTLFFGENSEIIECLNPVEKRSVASVLEQEFTSDQVEKKASALPVEQDSEDDSTEEAAPSATSFLWGFFCNRRERNIGRREDAY